MTFLAVHQPGGVSRCSVEILGGVASHPAPPRLMPLSVFSGVSTRGTFSSYKASLPSLLSSTPGSLGLPPSLWHFPEHPFAQGRLLDAPAWHPSHRHKRGHPARGAGWEMRCCDRVPRPSLTASPNLPSGSTFFFLLHSKCQDRISWGIWGHVQVGASNPTLLSAGWEGKVALPGPLWAFGGTNLCPALLCWG